MDKSEALEVAAARIAELRALPYEELSGRLLDRSETSEAIGASGARYQLEAQAVLDDPRRNRNLRVMVMIDDGGVRTMMPLSNDFIVAPDGSFVGE